MYILTFLLLSTCLFLVFFLYPNNSPFTVCSYVELLIQAINIFQFNKDLQKFPITWLKFILPAVENEDNFYKLILCLLYWFITWTYLVIKFMLKTCHLWFYFLSVICFLSYQDVRREVLVTFFWHHGVSVCHIFWLSLIVWYYKQCLSFLTLLLVVIWSTQQRK